ncbi:MAG: hypothetical protein ABJQ71_23135 [Roseibium sp.]
MHSEYIEIDSTKESIAEIAQELANSDPDLITAFDFAGVGAAGPELADADLTYAEPTVVIDSEFSDSQKFLRWKINAKDRSTVLNINGSPLIAKAVNWSYGRIKWKAGRGWPTYQVPCPPKQGSPSHKCTLKFGGQRFQPCTTPVSGVGQHPTDVRAYVDDHFRYYGDNHGYFHVIIHAYWA